MTRKTNMSFANACVFPGGVCDPADKHHNKEKFIEYGKVTAIRETFEETGLLVLPEGYDVKKVEYKMGESTHELVNRVWDGKALKEMILPVIRLMTIQMKGKRYDTWFYVTSPKTKIVNFKQYLSQNNNPKVLGNMDNLIADD